MAQKTFIEHNGERILLDGAERFTEWTCDGCGQFAQPYTLAHVNLQIHAAGSAIAQQYFEVHPSCMPKVLDAIATALVEASVRA